MKSLHKLVHLCPAVPIAPKQEALIAMSRFASSMITVALLPPSSKIDFPNLFWTVCATILPT